MNHVVEEERGTYVARTRNRHRGYWAGDFSGEPIRTPDVQVLLRLSRQLG